MIRSYALEFVRAETSGRRARDSERRVIVHCRSLLERDGLSGEKRRRLTCLATEAEEQLQRLAA
jgi:hypothetical protein